MLKYRLIQPLLSLGMILLNIIYLGTMLVLWPLFFIGGLLWKKETFWKINDFFFSSIPNIPEQEKHEDDENI